jgi:hypothetical protein
MVSVSLDIRGPRPEIYFLFKQSQYVPLTAKRKCPLGWFHGETSMAWALAFLGADDKYTQA